MTEQPPEEIFPIVGSSFEPSGRDARLHAPLFPTPRRFSRLMLAQLEFARATGTLAGEFRFSVSSTPRMAIGVLGKLWNRKLLKELQRGLERQGFQVERAVMENDNRGFELHVRPS